MARHSPAAVAAFQDGEKRLVWSLRGDSGELWLLPDGQAHAAKAMTHRCPVDRCGAEVRPVARHPHKRDGFMHRTGEGGHGPESLFHLQAKVALAEWLRRKYPRSDVRVEKALDGTRERIADVLLVSPDGSHRVAFEVQYAAEPPERWRERHRWYQEHGVVDVWLFGHAGKQAFGVRTHERRGDEVLINPTHLAVVEARLPLMWFNPIDRTIATLTSPRDFEGSRFVTLPSEPRGEFEVELIPLDEFQMVPDGMWSKHTRAIAEACERLDEAVHESHRRREEQLAAAATVARHAEEARQRRLIEKQARERADDARRQREAEDELRRAQDETRLHFSRSAEAWLTSDDRTRVKGLFGDLPEHLDVDVHIDLPVANHVWQTRFYFERIHDAITPERLEVAELTTRLQDRHPSQLLERADYERAIKSWMDSLLIAGVIEHFSDHWRGQVFRTKTINFRAEQGG